LVVSTHPPVLPITVYVVVVVGLAVGLVQFVHVSPVEGLQAYVVAPLAVRLTLLPLQIAGFAGVTDTTGIGVTVITRVVSLLHPLALVTDIVYVVVAAGVIVVTEQFVQFNPVPGDHAYVVPPEVVIVVKPPAQTLSLPEIVTLILPVTVTVTVVESLHPAALIPTTVYVVVDAGLAFVVEQFVQESPVAGFQVYVEAPPAVRDAPPPPIHILADVGDTVTVGIGLTVKVILVSTWQPLEFLTVTE